MDARGRPGRQHRRRSWSATGEPASGAGPSADDPGDDPGDDPDVPDADPESVARNICLRLLTGRARTRAELATAMKRRGVSPTVIDTVLDRLEAVGLVDDRALAAAWVESRQASRALSRPALSGELRRRGVAPELVDDAVARVDAEAELAGARSLVARRLAASQHLPYEARVRRLAGMLSRRGYPPGVALRVVRDALSASAEEVREELEQ